MLVHWEQVSYFFVNETFGIECINGWGHDMRAFALRDWWRQMGGDCQVYHPLEETFWGYKSGCQLYNLIQRKLPLLHYAYFNFLEFASIHHSPAKIIGAKKFTQKS